MHNAYGCNYSAQAFITHTILHTSTYLDIYTLTCINPHSYSYKTHICMHTHTCTYIHTHTHTCTHIHTHTLNIIHTCTYTYPNSSIHKQIHTHIQALYAYTKHKYIYTHIYTHTTMHIYRELKTWQPHAVG